MLQGSWLFESSKCSRNLENWSWDSGLVHRPLWHCVLFLACGCSYVFYDSGEGPWDALSRCVPRVVCIRTILDFRKFKFPAGSLPQNLGIYICHPLPEWRCLIRFSFLFSCWVGLSMDRSTPGLPVLHHLLQLTQTHVHWVGDAVQPSHPLSSPSPPAFHLSQHQGLFQWVSSSHQVAKVLELQLQHQSFQWIFRPDFLYDWLVWSPCCQGALKSLL